MAADVISLEERRRERRDEPRRLSIALRLAVLLSCLALALGRIS
jgi:hypothetical protein